MSNEHNKPWVPIVVALIAGLLGGGAGGKFLFDRIFPENHAPQVQIQVSPAKGKAPLEVSITANGSYDPDGDQLERIWSIDGETLETQEVAFTHTFTQAKIYSVSIRVLDPGGLEAQAAKSVVVDAGFTLREFFDRVYAINNLMRLGEMETAATLANFILAKCATLGQEQCALLHSLKGEALEKLNRLGESREQFKRAIKLQPERLDYQLAYAKILIRRTEYDVAIGVLSQAADRSPLAYQAHYYLAIAFAMDHKLDEAQASFGYVWRNSQRIRHRARFGLTIIKLALGPQAMPEAEMRNLIAELVCADPELRQLAADVVIKIDPDLRHLHMLIAAHLDRSLRDRLNRLLEDTRCY